MDVTGADYHPIIENSNPNAKIKDHTISQAIALRIAQLCSTAAVILVCIWTVGGDSSQVFIGSINWTDKIFGWHPILMTVGMIFCSVQGMLSYRSLPLGKKVNKSVHGLWLTAGIICSSIGLYAIFSAHSHPKEDGTYYPNLASMHSWIGLAAFVLFAQNYILGIGHFLFSFFSAGFKALYLPKHKIFGISALIVASVAFCTGISEFNGYQCEYVNTSVDTNPASHYLDLPLGCRVSQGLGIVVIVSVLTAVYAVVDIHFASAGITGLANSE